MFTLRLQVFWPGVHIEQWYYIEISWSSQSGLEVFADRKLVANASTSVFKLPSGVAVVDGNLYIGRSRSVSAAVANVIIDEIGICYGDRSKLVRLGFLHSGQCVINTIH